MQYSSHNKTLGHYADHVPMGLVSIIAQCSIVALILPPQFFLY